MKHKFFLQIFLSLLISLFIYFKLGINFIYLPFLGAINLNLFFIPISIHYYLPLLLNFFNITVWFLMAYPVLFNDLSFAFWILASTSLDTPITLFLALWIGALIAFLYFNVYPARIWLGDVGSLSFGATFAVIAILLGKIVPLMIVGALFIVEGMSSAIQIFSKILF